MGWEYRTIKYAAKGFVRGGNIDAEQLDRQMDKLGSQGWELVSTLSANENSGATRDILPIFKRQKN